MKKFRKPKLAILLASVVLFFSCEKNELLSQTSPMSKFSNEEIFQGIFFLNNEFTSKLKIISNSTLYKELEKYPNAKKGLENASKLILTKIKNSDSSFFQNFGDLVRSGNEYMVKEAIEKGTEKIIETYNTLLKENQITQEELSSYIANNNLDEFIDKSGNINKEMLNKHLENLNKNEYKTEVSGKAQKGSCIVVGIVFFAGVAILVGAVVAVVAAVNGGVVVNLVAAAFGWVEFGVPTYKKSNNGNLALEMLVSQITSIEKE